MSYTGFICTGTLSTLVSSSSSLSKWTVLKLHPSGQPKQVFFDYVPEIGLEPLCKTH